MHRVENKTAPSIFLTKFCKPSHSYPTNFSTHNFLVPTLKLKKSGYRASIRGPLLWNNILTVTEKTQESLPKFRTPIKQKLLSMTNEISYFWIGNIKAKNQLLSELISCCQLWFHCASKYFCLLKQIWFPSSLLTNQIWNRVGLNYKFSLYLREVAPNKLPCYLACLSKSHFWASEDSRKCQTDIPFSERRSPYFHQKWL